MTNSGFPSTAPGTVTRYRIKPDDPAWAFFVEVMLYELFVVGFVIVALPLVYP